LHPVVFAALFVVMGASSALAADDQPAPASGAATAAAAAAPATPAAPAKPKVDPEDQVICKTEPEPGSRLGGTRTCMKRRDWEQMSADARDQRNHAPPH
jgi:hypothetical protein